MTGIVAVATLCALLVWLAKGAPRRAPKLTDQQVMEQRQRAERAKRLRVMDAVNAAYEREPATHWWR